MAKVHVICGGTSDERAVSLRSGEAVREALAQAGYEVAVFDTSDSDNAISACDVVFPVLHGAGGEDGEFQERLEKLGVKFVGSGSVASRLCMDKAAYREHMIAQGFLMAQGQAVTRNEYLASPLAHAPHVLKPIDGGSSIDTHIIRDAASIDTTAVVASFTRHPRMVLEELIEGTELTVGVLGDRALPVIEIIPPSDGEFDYENKYNGQTQELCPPQHVSEAVQQAVQAIAVQVHNAAGCRDFSRSDFITTASGKHYLLETNTIPGMTQTSLFPKMAQTAGISMPELVSMLVGQAQRR